MKRRLTWLPNKRKKRTPGEIGVSRVRDLQSLVSEDSHPTVAVAGGHIFNLKPLLVKRALQPVACARITASQVS